MKAGGSPVKQLLQQLMYAVGALALSLSLGLAVWGCAASLPLAWDSFLALVSNPSPDALVTFLSYFVIFAMSSFALFLLLLLILGSVNAPWPSSYY